MKLIIFTAHYPYKSGETFIVDEINVLASKFDNITIVTSENNTSQDTHQTPNNIHVKNVNKNSFLISSFFWGLVKTMSLKSIKELLFMRKILGYKINANNIKKLFIYNFYSFKYIKWIKQNNPIDVQDILYSYWLSISAYSLSIMKKKGYRFKAISRAHGGDAFLDRGYIPYRREVYKYIDEIHFVSVNGRNQFYSALSNHVRGKKAKLFVSYLGSTNDENHLKDIQSKNNYNILTCSNIIKLKRLDILVDALSLINDHKITWTHLGDGELKHDIKYKIEHKLKNNNITVYLKGELSNIDVKNYYRSNEIDLFINMSDFEGVPVSIMEAMSFGIPCIAKDVGGNNEIIKNNYNGYLLDKNANYIDYKKSILNFFSLSISEKQRFKRNSYMTWRKKFNAYKNYSKFSRILKKHIF